MPEKLAEMLRADMADAGIPYRDDTGRVADFHALRHTYITNLARGGVHPKVDQQLARHSTITLTMDRYSHTVVSELSDALDCLPELDRPEPERQRATGTCDIAPKSLPIGLPKSLPTQAASQPSLSASRCTEAAVTRDCHQHGNPAKIGVSCTSLHPDASDDIGVSPLRRTGLEPVTFGSVDGARSSP